MKKVYETELWHYGVKGMKWRRRRHSHDGDDNENNDEPITGMLTARPNFHSRERHDSGKSGYAIRKRRFGTSPYDVGILSAKHTYNSRKRHDSGKSGYAFRRRKLGTKKQGMPVFQKIQNYSK